MRLAYTTPTSRAIPKSASVFAAKVLYKLLPEPTDTPSDIKEYGLHRSVYILPPKLIYLFQFIKQIPWVSAS